VYQLIVEGIDHPVVGQRRNAVQRCKEQCSELSEVTVDSLTGRLTDCYEIESRPSGCAALDDLVDDGVDEPHFFEHRGR
jgi:hypothetical protein